MEHFWPIGEHVMLKERKGTLADAVPWPVKNELAGYLVVSPIFTPEAGLTLISTGRHSASCVPPPLRMRGSASTQQTNSRRVISRASVLIGAGSW